MPIATYGEKCGLALGLVADLYGPVTALLIAASLIVGVGAAFAIVAPETHPASAPTQPSVKKCPP